MVLSRRWRIQRNWATALVATLVCGSISTGFASAALGSEAEDSAFFESKVRPVLVQHCYTCHSATTNAKGGLRVDDRGGLLAGGNRGAAVVPGDAEQSLLVRAVKHADKKLRMPPGESLSDEQIADLVAWIESGAYWPTAEALTDLEQDPAAYERLKQTHWAWQELTSPTPPSSEKNGWSLDPIDQFVWASLNAKGLEPTVDADKQTLLRRVTFDLTGLPPTPEELADFVADASPDAFEKVVDRLLASPAFGERWARHWLDVARYGESTGSSRNIPYPHAWRYRDYVIEAFNNDVPYDQFIKEQIAGDLLPAETEQDRERQLVATGFLAIGVKDVNQRFKVRFTMDNIDEQIDTVTRSTLALTVSCARCHDHMFDPVPARDYYALAGIFHSTEQCAGVRSKMGGGGLDYYAPQSLIRLGGDNHKVDPKLLAKAQRNYEKAREEFLAIRGTPEGMAKGKGSRPKQRQFRLKMDRAQAELMQLTDPALQGEAAMGVRDAATIGDIELRIRGEAEQLGPVVPRGYLSAVRVPNAPSVPTDESGRRELAEWITSPHNSLASRVIVNRIWRNVFGEGLVRTVDNFGTTGDKPSHPELLDYLVHEFKAEGQSTKLMVRRLVLTRTYQLSSAVVPGNQEIDPENRYLWRHRPRRLTGEELRDAVLASAGSLDLSPPSKSIASDLKVVELLDTSKPARQLEAAARRSRHRSVYLPLVRNLTPVALSVFDFAEQGMVTGSRSTTTVPTQALYLLNDSLVHEHSIAMAKRITSGNEQASARQIELLYLKILGRSASSEELNEALDYLDDIEQLLRRDPGESQYSDTLAVASVNNESVILDSDSDIERSPDEIPAEAAPEIVDAIEPVDSRTAAWASLCRALLSSAEFRYVR